MATKAKIRLKLLDVFEDFCRAACCGYRKLDIVVTVLVVVCVCIRASVQICPDHNLYNNAWISKQFGTVVALEEDKCHLKHFLGSFKIKVTWIK